MKAVAAAAGLCCAGLAAAAMAGLDAPSATGARSGYAYLSPETRHLQDDEFANPGMLWVEEGERLWKEPAGQAGKSCASCHGDAKRSMRTVATRYPAYSARAGRVINLEQRINGCRTGAQKADALAAESRDLLALTAFVSHQAKGLPMAVAIGGPAAGSFERGRAFFYQRRGQLNLSCANCHEANAGRRMRGETISEGQVNGFPIYRQLWQTMGSTNRMFAWCNEAVRAEPYPAGAQEYVDLELYLRWRGRGLAVETPAVRR
ncbi:MAG: sulfur oxidation c-type cytochrome SoxA [Sphingobium sp.]